MSGLKIYFGGSMSAGRQDGPLYAKIVKTLKEYGTVLTEHVGDEAAVQTDSEADPKEIHDRDMVWMKDSDVMVAEVTVPSLGVGYEIGRAIHLNIPVLCLFRPDSGKRLSCMIDGGQDGKALKVIRYKEEEYPEILKEYFANFQK